VVTSQLVRIAEALPKYQQNVRQKLDLINAANGTTFNRAITSIEQLDEEFTLGTPPIPSSNVLAPPSTFPTQVSVVPPRVGVLTYLRDNLFPIFKPFGLAGIVLVFTIYMLIKREEMRNRLLLLAGMGHINIMSQAIDEAASRISAYLIMQFTVNSIYGLLFGFGMFCVGVPNATLWGVIACIFRFVPYLGALLSAALPCALALAVFQSWWPPILVILIYGVLEIITANFIEPWLYGSHTGVSALALLVLAVVWGLIWGWAGLVLSTPLTVCLIVLGRYVPQFSFLHTLLGDEAELSPEAQFYERLLAMDQAEARAIAARFLKNKPLVELYDKVILPALTLAENDRHKGVLDEAKANFLILSTNELVVEFADLPADMVGRGGAETGSLASGDIGGRKPPVVCFSASDQADELAATMLAQLLERCDHNTLLLPSGSLSEEVLSRMAEAPETIVCISAIPPLAFAHARATCLRVRKHLAGNRIMIGLWGASDDPDELRDRFGAAKPEAVLTSLTGALAQVQQWERDSLSSTVSRR
jgi:predicted PurR-regulated permease PerM